jgi:hypothetical protein
VSQGRYSWPICRLCTNGLNLTPLLKFINELHGKRCLPSIAHSYSAVKKFRSFTKPDHHRVRTNVSSSSSSSVKQPFYSHSFLRRFCQICVELDHPLFKFLDFATVKFLQSKINNLASTPPPPPNLQGQVSVFMFSNDMMAQLQPQASGSLFVAFCDSQVYGGGILTHLHTGTFNIQKF